MKTLTAAIVTLGCRLNQADSALLTGRFRRMNIETVPYTPSGADIILINSCAVTATAARKSRQTVRQFRQRHPEAILILTGCAADVDRTAVDAIDGIDLILTNEGKKELEPKLRSLLLERGKNILPAAAEQPHIPLEQNVFAERVLSEFPSRSRANLKIQEGCNNFCSYCIVPFARGRERSRDFQETMDDFKRLLDAGFHEIALTGINICAYSCEGRRLPDLLEKLVSMEGNFRLRLGSTEPGEILLRVIDLMAEANGKICEFLHPSLQHGSDTILKAMNRHYLTGMYREFVDHARKKVPRIHIGTDLIVGFPGETDALFEESFAFVKSIGFSNMHLFPFSPREGTRAAQITPRVHGELVEQRLARLHQLADEMSAAYRRSLIGSWQTVIPENCSGDSGTGWTGSYVRTRIRREGLRPGEPVQTLISGMDDSGILLGN